MPRPLRIELEGEICHPPSCTATAGQASCIGGDRREPIFRDDADRRRFLDTLGEACAKTDGQESAEAQAEGLVRIARRLRAEKTNAGVDRAKAADGRWDARVEPVGVQTMKRGLER